MLPSIPHLINAAVLSLLFIHAAKDAAPRLRLMDLPGGRKRHLEATPAVGGIGIFAAFGFAVSLDPHLLDSYYVLLLGMAFLTIVGSVDDAISLRPVTKAALQTVAALVLVGHGLRIDLLGDFGAAGRIASPAISVILTIVFVVGVINAVNMVDGVDGLAGGIIASGLFWLAVGAYLSGFHEMWITATLLLMGVIGFLAFNLRAPWRRKASVFLGDAGSMALGFALLWFSLQLTQGPRPAISAAGCALIFALPTIDTLSLLVRRLAAGRNPMLPDRHHLHHLLENAHLRPATISLLLSGMSFGLGGFGVIGSYLKLPDVDFVALLLLVAVAHSVAVRALPHRAKEEQPAARLKVLSVAGGHP